MAKGKGSTSSKSKSSGGRARSAITGRFVKPATAAPPENNRSGEEELANSCS